MVITSEELREALEPLAAEILKAVTGTLEETPPELASDLAERGLLLAGGGALLWGLAERLEAETGLTVRMPDDPLTCVALGAGRSLEEMAVLEHRTRRARVSTDLRGGARCPRGAPATGSEALHARRLP